MKTLILTLMTLISSSAFANTSAVIATCVDERGGSAQLVVDPTNSSFASLVLSPSISAAIVEASYTQTTATTNSQKSVRVTRGLPSSLSLLNEGSRQIVVRGLIKQSISNSYATGGQGGSQILFKNGGAVLYVNNTKMLDSKTAAFWNVATIEFKSCK